MEAAYEVFTAKGYASATISDVAAKAGIGQGTVYRYFGSKREIVDHVIDFGIEKIIDAVDLSTLAGDTDSAEALVDALRAIVGRLYDLVDREPQVLRLLLVEAGAIDAELAERLIGLEGFAASVLAAELARGVRAGWIRPELDPEVIAHTILTLVWPWILRELHGGGSPQAREHSTEGVLRILEKVLHMRSAS
ncbi:TetR/AcrR family transcriptional regulator [Nocardia huaxiensis]|uniref:TetR/AcrR family transcriptional regulator n=1 Tax=Nocardia huaxiensis TaxID=2755382 RepID=UPI0023EBCD55|nr:TetR/AcrR family transcriptional regulator [Nocardia huaxiensis]